MTLSVESFKERLKGGGARSNLFKVTVKTWKGIGLTDNDAAAYLVEAASLPASTIQPIEVPFKGRRIKLAGDRTFEPWTMTCLNDSKFVIRNALENWMNVINTHSNAGGVVNPNDYTSDVTVEQLARDGSTLKTYTLISAWPSDLSAIDVSFANENEIERFQCTWQYDYWIAEGSVPAGGGFNS